MNLRAKKKATLTAYSTSARRLAGRVWKQLLKFALLTGASLKRPELNHTRDAKKFGRKKPKGLQGFFFKRVPNSKRRKAWQI